MFAGVSNVTHGGTFDTDQLQPINDVTKSEFVSPPGPCAALFVESAKVHAAPACVTVKLFPAMLTVPVRESAVGLDCNVKLMFDGPELSAGDSSAIHGGRFDTLQLQPMRVVTATEPVVADAPNTALFDDSANVQLAPDWVTVKLFPAMLNAPVRESAVGLACNAKLATPLFVLLVGELSEIHGPAETDALHTQPVKVVTVTAPVAAAEANAAPFEASE